MARPVRLDTAAVEAVLAGPDGPSWELVDSTLVKSVECPSFPSAIDFVVAVGGLAEEADHHPDIDIRWRKVTLRFITHDAGNKITALDTRLAGECDLVFSALDP